VVGQSGCSTTARAVGRGYAVRIPQRIYYEVIINPHNSSGGGNTALLVQGFVPVLYLLQLYHIFKENLKGENMKINFIEDKIIFSLSKKLFMESSKNNSIIILHREDFLKLWKNEPNPINKELNEGNPEIWKKDYKYKEAERGFSYGYKNPVPLGKIVINKSIPFYTS